MSCSQTLTAIAKDCNANIGGVKRVYVANADDVTAVTVTSGKITGITMASGKKFLEFAFRANTASMTSTWQVSAETGAKYVQTLLAMQFSRMETSKRLAIQALALADAVAIVEDMNGAFWYLGYEFPLELNAGDGGTGTQRTDRNGYGITLEDDCTELPLEVDDTIISGITS